jgi:acyl-CoA thioesterase FadM
VSAERTPSASPSPRNGQTGSGREGFRFELRLSLRHTDSFGGTPFVHGGVMLALTEIALEAYDTAASIPAHRDVLRFQTHTELRYLAPLRWDDAAIVRMRCTEARAGRLRFDCELAAASTGITVARIAHRYAYVNAQTGRAETPPDWPAIASAIRAFEPVPVPTDAVSVSPSPAQRERGPGGQGPGRPGGEGP